MSSDKALEKAFKDYAYCLETKSVIHNKYSNLLLSYNYVLTS
jgi:hypothetical protein